MHLMYSLYHHTKVTSSHYVKRGFSGTEILFTAFHQNAHDAETEMTTAEFKVEANPKRRAYPICKSDLKARLSEVSICDNAPDTHLSLPCSIRHAR